MEPNPLSENNINIEDIQDKITLLIEKSKTSYAFGQKLQSVAFNLEHNLTKLTSIPQDIKQNIDQETLNSLAKEIGELSEIIDTIKNYSIFLTYLFDNKPIEKITKNIDNHMKNIISLLEKMQVDSPEQFSSRNYDDYTQISDLLIELQQNILRRRREVEMNIKQNHDHLKLEYATQDYDKENRDELAELIKIHPEYRINLDQLNILDTNKILYQNDHFFYYDGMYQNKKVTVLKLKKEYKLIYKRLLSVLIKIDHPYIEKFIGSYIDGKDEFIVTNRKGKNLSQYLLIDGNKDRTILAFKIAEAMLYLHSRNVIHRKLIEDNIFIPNSTDNEEKVKEANPMICGFRDSRFLPINPSTSSVSVKNIKYEEEFRAPELSESKYDEKIDVFAFSGILYKLITNKNPLENSNLLKDRCWRPPLPADLPENLRNLITSCWEQDPKKRFSFDKIIATMIRGQIVFPCDKDNTESILEFYKGQSIKNTIALKCIDLFEEVKKQIDSIFQYRFEFLRIRSTIHSYQYLIRSKYAETKEFTKEETDLLNGLDDVLDSLSSLIHETDREQLLKQVAVASGFKRSYIQSAESYHFTKITEVLKNIMIDLHDIMSRLGFKDIEEYKESKDDLVFDYRELMNFYSGLNNQSRKANEKVKIKEKVDEIEKHLKKEFDDELTCAKLNDRLHDLFTPFYHLKIDRDDIEKFENTKIVGKYSEVYQGKYKKYDLTVAIKIIRKEHLKDENELTFLRREIGILAKLRHKNIAKFYGYSLSKGKENNQYDNDVWLISEWIPDGSLKERLHSNNPKNLLSPNDKAKIAYEIAEAMEYIHSENVLYLDLNPSNILLLKDPDSHSHLSLIPKIIDFSSARLNGDTLGIKKEKLKHINYMSSEVQSGKKYGKYSDIYSYSMILWEMITGVVPLSNIAEDLLPVNIENGVNLDFNDHFDANSPLKDIISSGTRLATERRTSDFGEILRKMRIGRITFNGGRQDEMTEFYEKKIEKSKLIGNLPIFINIQKS
ncbi:protein kinase activity protein [Tritrichomonas musculus]|uniref:Protein kinase activity protein n=1 Tax=Tritrichomonas musculus TaxID=1915356 RepID=A0ABR2GNT6_9EUKA